MYKVILTDPEWDWGATRDVTYSIRNWLRLTWGVGLDDVKVIKAVRPDWRVPVMREITFIPARYRYIDKKGIRERLWRFLGGMFKKPYWGRRKVMLEPSCSEDEDIRLEQGFIERPDGSLCIWWMGYGPKSKYLAIGAWEGATGFTQSRNNDN